MRYARHSRVAEFLLQESNVRRRVVPRARSVHPVDETQKYPALFERRGPDHPFRYGVLRLRNSTPQLIACPITVRVEFSHTEEVKEATAFRRTIEIGRS